MKRNNRPTIWIKVLALAMVFLVMATLSPTLTDGAMALDEDSTVDALQTANNTDSKENEKASSDNSDSQEKSDQNTSKEDGETASANESDQENDTAANNGNEGTIKAQNVKPITPQAEDDDDDTVATVIFHSNLPDQDDKTWEYKGVTVGDDFTLVPYYDPNANLSEPPAGFTFAGWCRGNEDFYEDLMYAGDKVEIEKDPNNNFYAMWNVDVKITGNQSTTKYNGQYQSVEGFTVSGDATKYVNVSLLDGFEAKAEARDASYNYGYLMPSEYMNLDPEFFTAEPIDAYEDKIAGANIEIEEDGYIDIEPIPLTVKIKDASKVYGDPDPEFEIDAYGLAAGDEVFAKVIRERPFWSDGRLFDFYEECVLGSPHGLYIKDGEEGITIMNAEGEDVTSNYYFYDKWLEYGTLTITKRPLTIISGSASKVYDGTPLVCYSLYVDPSTPLALHQDIIDDKGNPIFNDTITDDYTLITLFKAFFGSQTEVGTSENSFYGWIIHNNYGHCFTDDNYDIKFQFGTLTVTNPPASPSSGWYITPTPTPVATNTQVSTSDSDGEVKVAAVKTSDNKTDSSQVTSPSPNTGDDQSLIYLSVLAAIALAALCAFTALRGQCDAE